MRIPGGDVIRRILNPVTIALLCLLGCTQKSNVPSIPHDYTLYRGLDVAGSPFLFALPSRFTIQESRLLDEYYFTSREGEQISVVFYQNVPESYLDFEKSLGDQSPKPQVELELGGAAVHLSVYEASTLVRARHPKVHWSGLGFWSKGRSRAAVDVLSAGDRDAASAELTNVLRSIHLGDSTSDSAAVSRLSGKSAIALPRLKE
jgi:hypothetical protein